MDPNYIAETEKKDHRPHVVIVPFPAQGHINPLMKLAKLLHHQGFHVTFVHSEYNHRRLLRSRGPSSLDGSSSFRFATIPDGLPFSDAPQAIQSLIVSTRTTCLAPFKDLLARLNSDHHLPPVSCIVWDSLMPFALVAAQELAVPDVLFWAGSAAGFLPRLYLPRLQQRGLVPLQDESILIKKGLDTIMEDWIPGMKDIRLKDLPHFIRPTDPYNATLHRFVEAANIYQRASALVLNTFETLEHQCLSFISSLLSCPVYSIGPMDLLETHMLEDDDDLDKKMGSSLWREESNCLEWLDAKEPGSVLYVNFGSMAVMTNDQLVELAWGLANSNKTFLWVVRPDLVDHNSELLIPPNMEENGMLVGWCPQVEVLNHPAIGGFLTHCGWNSIVESICAGVPVICWPFMADQHTIRRYCCVEWGIGLEFGCNDEDVKREDVKKAVIEIMDEDKGRELKMKVLDWKDMAHQAAKHEGSSRLNFYKLVTHLTKSTLQIKVTLIYHIKFTSRITVDQMTKIKMWQFRGDCQKIISVCERQSE